MSSVSRILSAAVLPLLLATACSHHGNAAPAMPAPALQIASVDPAAGHTGVVVRSPVRVIFGEDIVPPADVDFEVDDAIGPLAGLHSYDASQRLWTWTPVSELPRGATLRAVLGTGLRGRS